MIFFLLNQCADVFKNMFAQNQHLDIISITDEQEQSLRNLCCPFYTCFDLNVHTPDFYLFSFEGYHLDDFPRACFMLKRLYGKRLDGYMLCDISPIIIGQSYGNQHIQQVIIANRLDGTSLFPISEWPMAVYVMRLLNENAEFKEVIDKTDVDLIAWAEIFKRKEDINLT